MGQQQLLLLVLGIVIVGIAVVAGIQAFSEGKDKAEQDAAVSDAMRIISDVQAWELKPQAFGGGQGNTDTPTFTSLGYKENVSNSQATYRTLNGCYTISGGSGQNNGIADIAVHRLGDNEDVTSTGACGGEKIADVVLDGTTPSDISWTYATGGS